VCGNPFTDFGEPVHLALLRLHRATRGERQRSPSVKAAVAQNAGEGVRVAVHHIDAARPATLDNGQQLIEIRVI
jgi:hypothetical protein